MRRLREELNYFCKCGHVKRQHIYDDYTGYCNQYYDERQDYYGPCNCQMYRLDNLRYLETLVNEA